MTYIWVIQLFNYSLNNPIKYQLCVKLKSRPLRNTEITHYRRILNMLSCHWRHWKRQTCTQVRLQGYKDYTQAWRTFDISQKSQLAIFSRLQESESKMALGMHNNRGETWVTVLLIFFLIWSEGRPFSALNWNSCTSGAWEALYLGCFKLRACNFLTMVSSQPFSFT